MTSLILSLFLLAPAPMIQKGIHRAKTPAISRFAYVLPDTTNTIMHVNADDLYKGTAKKGTPWSKIGNVPFVNNGGNNADSVGILDDNNYYSQTTSLVSTAPWTAAIVINTTNVTPGIAIGNGTYESDGWYLYLGVGAAVDLTVNTSGVGAINGTSNNLLLGQNIIIFGFDALGNTYVQLNGGTTSVLGTGVVMASPLHDLLLGRYNISTGLPFGGYVQEVEISTDVPSSGTFTALYNTFVTNYTSPNRYFIAETSNIVTHMNAADFHNGTSKVGGTWAVAGTTPYNLLDFPNPSIGPFSTANYFAQSASPLAFPSSSTFTVAIVFKNDGSFGAVEELLSIASGGFILLNDISSTGWSANNGIINLSSPDAAHAGANILFGGYDGTNLIVQLNNGFYQWEATSYTQAGTAAYLGVGASDSYPNLDNNIIEVWGVQTFNRSVFDYAI